MSTTYDHHAYADDFKDSHVKVLPNDDTLKSLDYGPTYCVIRLGGNTTYINAKDYAAAIRHFSTVVSHLRAAHHKATKATGKRCGVNIGLIMSGGESFPSGAAVADAFEHYASDSLSFKEALRGHTIDDIIVNIASLP